MKSANYDKNRWSCIKPELIDDKNYYSFTLSPLTQPVQDCLGRLKLNSISDWYHKDIKRDLNRLSNCEINACCETSSGGRLHWHGTIKIKNIANFYFHDIPLLKKIGCYEIDTIKDLKIWLTYCSKQESFMKPFCDFNQMDYVYNSRRLTEKK